MSTLLSVAGDLATIGEFLIEHGEWLGALILATMTSSRKVEAAAANPRA